MRKVTPQQEIFCQQVALGKSQAESYRIAYPKSKKWKDEAVWVKSSELVKTGNVMVRIDELREKHQKHNEVTLEQVLKQMAFWLDFDPLEMMDENDCVKSMKELPVNVRKSIHSIEVQELYAGSGENRTKIGELKKIKFVDKRATADMFMKKFGAYATKLKFDDDDLEHIKDLVKEIKG